MKIVITHPFDSAVFSVSVCVCMDRAALEQLSKQKLVEIVLKLQRLSKNWMRPLFRYWRLLRCGRGNWGVACYDNAAVETFFMTIKAELIWRRSSDCLSRMTSELRSKQAHVSILCR